MTMKQKDIAMTKFYSNLKAMNKITGLLFLALFLNTSLGFSQTPISKTKQVIKPALSEKDLMMCDKEWHTISVEEWGVVTKPPGEKNVQDMLKLTADGSFELILFGIKKSGTWKKSGEYIYFTDVLSKGKFSYKILLVEASKLKVDHFSEEEGHSIFEMESK